MLIRRMLDLKDGQKIDKCKPTHGPCCTCQKCGYSFDDCKCWENDKIEICEYVEATQAENAKLKELVNIKNEFLAVYRTGKNVPEKVWTRFEKLRELDTALKGE